MMDSHNMPEKEDKLQAENKLDEKSVKEEDVMVDKTVEENTLKEEISETAVSLGEEITITSPEITKEISATESETGKAANTIMDNELLEESNLSSPEKEVEELPTCKNKTDIVARLKSIIENNEEYNKKEIDYLKISFYKLHKAEREIELKKFIENGGTEEDFSPVSDPDEASYKTLMSVIKTHRAEQIQGMESKKETNLERKLAIIERIKTMAVSPDEANRSYKEFKVLQAEWKEIRLIPIEKANELWKNYQLYVEQFYDMLKLNIEAREYDFKKNLEKKTHLCETAEQLAEEKDVVKAFHKLQELHQEFRETGPVSKELRDEIWDRFKVASSTINKRHQQYFETLKEKEKENLEKKTALCENIEAITTDELKTSKEWEAKTKEIISIQTEWRTIGFAPQKMNEKIFQRFRTACDDFFQKKAEYFQNVKKALNENLAKKTELCDKAEALSNSTDWKTTTDELIKIQNEWKTIGSVPRRVSEVLWKRFTSACDKFFNARNEIHASQNEEEKENLEKKLSLIEKLNALLEEKGEDAQQTMKDLMNKWNETGFVPFKEKDKIYKEYHNILDKLFKELNVSTATRRLNNFKKNIRYTAKEGTDSLISERTKLLRAYESMKSSIQTYENNLGFLNASSKKGNSLVNEMNQKVERLKNELNLILEKINVIDEQHRKDEQKANNTEDKD